MIKERHRYAVEKRSENAELLAIGEIGRDISGLEKRPPSARKLFWAETLKIFQHEYFQLIQIGLELNSALI